MLNSKELFIPDFYSVLTKEGWESLQDYTFRIPLLIQVDGKLTYQLPKIWSTRNYQGSIKKLSTSIGPFYMLEEQKQVETYCSTYLIKKVTEVLWEGKMFSFDFRLPCSLPVKLDHEYFMIPLS